jgi:hypothetical protein
LGHKQTHAPQQKDRYSITSSARANSVGKKLVIVGTRRR